MSRVFIGTPFFTYRPGGAGDGGTVGAGLDLTSGSRVFYEVQETNLCMPNPLPSRIIALRINWNTYGAPGNFVGTGPFASIGVEVDIPQNVSDKLGRIGSLYIDNTNSTIPIYINFPDTGFTITAPPSSSVWYPVFTNKFRFQVVALNMVAGFVPLTKIFVSNREIGPSVDNEFFNVVPQWVGTTSAQFAQPATATSGFGAPALGDRTAIQQSAFTTVTTTSGFTITDLSNLTGFIYITAIDVSFDVFGGVVSAAGNTLSMAFNFGDNLGNFMLRGAVAARDATATPQSLNVNAIKLSGLNLRYIATGNLFVIATDAPVVSAGTITSVRWRATANIVYSNNPK